MCLWSTSGSFEVLVTNIWTWTFWQSFCTCRGKSFLTGGFAVCIGNIFMRPHLDVTRPTRDCVLNGTVMQSVSRIVECLLCSLKGSWFGSIFVTLASTPVPIITAEAQCTCTIFPSLLQWRLDKFLSLGRDGIILRLAYRKLDVIQSGGNVSIFWFISFQRRSPPRVVQRPEILPKMIR